MNQNFLRTLCLLSFTCFAPAAFAIDQVVLSNGEILEGKVLNEVPNRFVDIELTNGTKKRFQKTEVTSVERDVPSNKDSQMLGTDSQAWIALQLGGRLRVNNIGAGNSNNVLFDYSALFGVNTAQLGNFSKLAFTLGADRYSSSSNSLTLGSLTTAMTEIFTQLLFRKVSNTGFYFGPEAGLAITSIDYGSLGSGSGTSFLIGATLGYDYYFSDSFSLGPALRIDSVGSTNISLASATTVQMLSTTDAKFLISFAAHF